MITFRNFDTTGCNNGQQIIDWMKKVKDMHHWRKERDSSLIISKNNESHQKQGDRSLNIGIKFLQIWEAP